jgi:hypothetical protein
MEEKCAFSVPVLLELVLVLLFLLALVAGGFFVFFDIVRRCLTLACFFYAFAIILEVYYLL